MSTSAALYLPLSPCICFSASPCVCFSFPLHLPRRVSLYKCLPLCHSFSPLPFPGSIPILWLAAPGGLQRSNGTAPGHLGALPRVPFPVTSTRPSPWRRLRFPSAAVGRGGGASEGRHSARHLLGSPGAPNPPLPAIKGAGSRGSEMIMVALARQPRSPEPHSERTI